MVLKELWANAPETKSLRIGSLVNVHEKGVWGNKPLTSDLLVGILGGRISYKPIPITKNWLLKFGFSDEVWQKLVLPDPQTGAVNSLTFNSGYLGFNQEALQGWTNSQLLEAMNNVKDNLKFNLDKMSFPPLINTNVLLNNKVVFIHQLQNIYFSLTGEELTIKQQASV